MLHHRRTPLKTFLILLTIQASAYACQVPVFRYALERWNADNFRLQLITRGAPPADLEKNLLGIQAELNHSPPPINLELETLDLEKLSPAQQLSVVGLEHVTETPTFLLHPPQNWGNANPIVLPGTESSLQQILHSPVRKKIVDHILAGESAVWLLIEGSDQAANAAAEKQLKKALAQAEKQIEIPDGVIRAEQLEEAGNEVNLDDVLRSSIPLKISFVTERVRRNDLAESVFLKILAGPTHPPADQPLVIPIFGRGRTPGPVPANAITPERIISACEYLCGACSCQVKSGNPGYDLLFRAHWQEHLQHGLVVVEKQLPDTLPSLNKIIPANDPTSEPQSPPVNPSLPISKLFLFTLPVILILGSFFILKKK